MGLPLFMSPVESDILPKPTAKSPADPAHVRSPIRRTEQIERRRHLQHAREHRLRLATSQGNPDEPLMISPAIARALYASATTDRPSAPQEDGVVPRLSNRSTVRPVEFDRAATPPFGSTAYPPAIESSDRRERRSTREDAPIIRVARPADRARIEDNVTQRQRAAPGRSSATSRDVAPTSNRQRNTRRGVDVRDLAPFWRARVRQELDWEHENQYFPMEEARIRVEQLRAERMGLIPTANFPERYVPRVRYADGLGDRDRSLSPEGDGAWETLQSTLTPDPQPPSIGSSFASTTASVNHSSTGINSVNTSMTTPDEVELPCDPVNDESEDVGEDERHAFEHSQQPTSARRRSYADVASDPTRQSPEATDSANAGRSEWLLGMHRIVRGLASRVDIPDEWWAQAGLSRSMSWEDSN